MPSLLDIAPPELATEDMDISGGRKLTIRGISALDWAGLYRRFPDLRLIIVGRAAEVANQSPLVGMAMQAAVIAAGQGELGNAECERDALSKLTSDDHGAVIARLITLSLPGAVFGPLLEGGESVAPSGKAPATK